MHKNLDSRVIKCNLLIYSFQDFQRIRISPSIQFTTKQSLTKLRIKEPSSYEKIIHIEIFVKERVRDDIQEEF